MALFAWEAKYVSSTMSSVSPSDSGVAEPSSLATSNCFLLADAFSALILLMMDILLKVPRLRLMVMFCRRFMMTGRLCASCLVLNINPLTVLACSRQNITHCAGDCQIVILKPKGCRLDSEFRSRSDLGSELGPLQPVVS